MSQTTTSINRLVRPTAGATVTVDINADNMRLGLGFATGLSNVTKEGQNLVFTFEDGGKIVLQDYYDHFANKTLPVMVTDEGEELTGEAFLASINEELLTTAGPQANASVNSGGSGEYEDAAGSLVGGIDRLGDAASVHWERGASLAETDPVSPTIPAPAPVPGGDAPATPPPAEPEVWPYHTRLIVTETEGNTFTFQAVDADGRLIAGGADISAAFKGGGIYFENISIDPVTGEITVSLTEEGLARLRSGQYASDLLVVSQGGADYVMPLVINEQSYDAPAEEGRAALGTDLLAEWYAADGAAADRATNTVLINGANITLGGSSYDGVNIGLQAASGLATALTNSRIDTTSSAAGEININVVSLGGGAFGIQSTGSKTPQAPGATEIQGGNARVEIDIDKQEGAGGATGIYTRSVNSATSTIIDAAGVKISADVSADAQGHVYGAYTSTNGSQGRDALLDIKAAGPIEITAANRSGDFTSGSTGIFTSSIGAGKSVNKGTTRLESTEGDVSITASSALQNTARPDMTYGAVGIHTVAKDGESLTQVAAKNVVITADTTQSENGDARGVYTSVDITSKYAAKSETAINADGNVAITASADRDSYGVVATVGSNNAVSSVSISAGGEVKVTATSTGGLAKGLAASGAGAEIRASGESVDVSAERGYGAYADKGGKIGLGDGDGRESKLVNIKGYVGVYADGGEVSANADQVKISGDAAGMQATHGGDIHVNAAVTTIHGGAYGLVMDNTSETHVNEKGGEASISGGTYGIYGGTVYLNEAGGGKATISGSGHSGIVSSNVVVGAGNDSVTVNDVKAWGLYAAHITDKGGDNTIVVDSKYIGMDEGSSIKTSTEAAGKDEITVSGLEAALRNSSISTGAGVDTVTLNGDLEASKAAGSSIDTGREAGDALTVNGTVLAMGGSNTITSATVTVNGIAQALSGSNTIDADTVNITGENSMVMRVTNYDAAASLNTNLINASGDVRLAYDGANTSVPGGQDNIHVMGAFSDSGAGRAENVVNAGGTVRVDLNSTSGLGSSVMQAEQAGARNAINAKTVQINAQVQTGGDIAVMQTLYQGGKNEIHADTVEIFASAKNGGQAYGMFAVNQGGIPDIGQVAENSIVAENVTMRVEGDANSSSNLLHAGKDGLNSIKASSSINLVAGSDKSPAVASQGVSADQGGKNIVDAGEDGKVTIAVHGGKAGVMSRGGEVRVIGDSVNIGDKTHDGATIVKKSEFGVYATTRGSISLGDGEDSESKLVSIAGSKAGVLADAGNVQANADKVTISGGTNGVQAANGGTASVNADEAALSGGDAGILSTSRGAVRVNAGEMTISGGQGIVGGGGTVYLNEAGGGKATISGSAGSGIASGKVVVGAGNDALTIQGKAYGLEGSALTDQGGDNTIIVKGAAGAMRNSSIETGLGNDVVWIQGDMTITEGAYAKNAISTGGGNDAVFIDGNINAGVAGSENRVETGAGNDSISLNGAVQGCLILDAGVGIDTLILRASTVQEFNDFYGKWLQGLDADTVNDMQIEEVIVNVGGVTGDLGGLSWLNDVFKDAALSFNVIGDKADNTFDLTIDPDVEYSGFAFDGGEGDDTLHLVLNGDDSSRFADFLQHNSLSNMETLILDMDNGRQDTLELGSLLESLHDDSGSIDSLVIKGGVNDNVDIAGLDGELVSNGLVSTGEYAGCESYTYTPTTPGGVEEQVTIIIQGAGILG